MAEPMPCTTRTPMRKERESAKIQVKEVRAKIPAPSMNNRAFPPLSASRPMGSRNTKAEIRKLPSTQDSDSGP